MPPKKKLSKGALWGIIGGSIAVVLAIVGIVLAVVFLGGPGKEDYNKAGDTLADAVTAYNKITANEVRLNTYITSDSSRQSIVDAIKQGHSEINTKLDELSKMKGVAGDKDVKEKYEAVAAKRDKFNNLINLELKIIDEFYPIITKMRSLGASATPGNIESLIKDIEGVSIDHESTKAFKNDMLEFLRAAKDNAEARAGGRVDSSASLKYFQAATKYQRAALKWQSDLKKEIEEAQIRSELNALRDILHDKYRK